MIWPSLAYLFQVLESGPKQSMIDEDENTVNCHPSRQGLSTLNRTPTTRGGACGHGSSSGPSPDSKRRKSAQSSRSKPRTSRSPPGSPPCFSPHCQSGVPPACVACGMLLEVVEGRARQDSARHNSSSSCADSQNASKILGR